MDVDIEGPDPIMDEAALITLSKSFGNGVAPRKILVSKGVTLKQNIEWLKEIRRQQARACLPWQMKCQKF
jgi:hypothetical protein